MFHRKKLIYLRFWAKKENRKPLVLRGARQVGKTSLVLLFSKEFDRVIHLNLEKPEHKALFKNIGNSKQAIEGILFQSEKPIEKHHKTLVFIDEIQESKEAFELLRFFYEDFPHIFVIVAGSLLESILHKNVSFPVGRVEYLKIQPLTFAEFLIAKEESNALKAMNTYPVPKFAHPKLSELFYEYSIIGGMPEIVKSYAANEDFISLRSVYHSLIEAYEDDIEKYEANHKKREVLRFLIKRVFEFAGQRITLNRFAKSNYGSKEIGEGMKTLEKAMLINLNYPTTQLSHPLTKTYSKAPKLQALDTGLSNFQLGIQSQLLLNRNLEKINNGISIEHLIGQQILGIDEIGFETLTFWVREKKTSQAEIDFLYQFKGEVFPIEVKSGATGKLRSLHMYMEMANLKKAVRFFGNYIHEETIQTPTNYSYTLLSLPHYLAEKLEHYL